MITQNEINQLVEKNYELYYKGLITGIGISFIMILLGVILASKI